jgi:Ca2+-binding EF-hand superfamily protein
MPLTEEQKAQVAELFEIYGTDNTSKIAANDFKAALRAFGNEGGYASEPLIKDLIDGQDFIDKAKFIQIVELRVLEWQILQKAQPFFFNVEGNPFKYLDEGNGLNGADLKKILLRLGDKLNEDEYKGIFAGSGIADPGDGPIDYEALWTALQSKLAE